MINSLPVRSHAADHIAIAHRITPPLPNARILQPTPLEYARPVDCPRSNPNIMGTARGGELYCGTEALRLCTCATNNVLNVLNCAKQVYCITVYMILRPACSMFPGAKFYYSSGRKRR
jgi:hypothetical protein